MKLLNEQEIKFLKETKYSCTVFQCDEWDRCSFKNFSEASTVATNSYGIDLVELNKKLFDGGDAISLEFAAGYLFYIFFTENELQHLSSDLGLKFLQDFKYFEGWRKAEEVDAFIAICDGIRLHQGTLVFTKEFGDDEVWYVEAKNK